MGGHDGPAAKNGPSEGTDVPKVSTEEDSYLSTLIESDQLEPAVRAVFEAMKDKEIQSNLENFIEKKEKDIGHICNWHYQEFIGAVDELLEVRSETRELKQNISTLNSSLQSAGSHFVNMYSTLLSHRHIRSNIGLAIQVTQDSIYVLEKISQIEKWVDERQYYMAIRNLSQLEKEYLPRVSQYSFIQYLGSNIPGMKERILQQSKKEFNDWLLNIRTHCGEIGKFSIDQTTAQHRLDKKKHISTRTIDVDTYQSRNHSAAPSAKENKKQTVKEEMKDEDIIQESLFDNSRYKIEFTPLYQCIHVYQYMDQLESFITYYRENRKLQANKALKPKHGLSFSTPDGYKKYFYDIAGIFIVEDTISKSTTNLVPVSDIEKLWHTAVAKMKGVLEEQMSYTFDPSALLQVKNFLYIFCRTMQAYGYDVSQLVGFFDNVRTTFADLAINSAHKRFMSILDEEKWTSLSVQDEKEYLSTIVENQLQITESRYLPQTFPFSRMVPQYCHIIKNLIIDFYKFAQNLPDLDEYTRKSTEGVIAQFNTTWMSFINGTKSMNVYTRTWVNFSHLQKVVSDWENTISKLSYQSTAVRLNTPSFVEFSSQIEAMLLELVENKVQEFVVAMKQQLPPWTPSSIKNEPRDYAQQMINWLDQNNQIWAILPKDIQSSLQFRALHKISYGIVGYIGSDEVFRFNSNALRAIDCDLRFMESYSERSRIPTSQDAMAELRQLIDLLLSDQMQEFEDPIVRKQRYFRLFDFVKLQHILEKFKEEARFFGRKGPKDQQIAALIAWLKKW